MKLNKDKVLKLLEQYAYNNYHEFARRLDIDASHIHRFLKTGVGGGNKLIGAVAKFCKKENLNFAYYVDLSLTPEFKVIDNWRELFNMTYNYIMFLVERDKISPEVIIKTTHNILQNTGYGYTFEDVSQEYNNYF